MNLTSKKARLVTSSVAVAALVAGGGWMASSALADPAPLTLTPGTTSIGITNLDPSVAGDANAQATFATKVNGLGSGLLRAAVVAGPASGALKLQRVAANGVPTATGTWVSVATPPSTSESSDYVYSGAAATPPSPPATPAAPYLNGDNLYIGATQPGTYTLALYGDTNGNGVLDAATDPAAPQITVHVYDVNNTTAVTTDDLQLQITAPEQVDKGRPIKAVATAAGLTTNDVRGIRSGSAFAELGLQIADVLEIGFTGANTVPAAASTFDGTGWTRTVLPGTPAAYTGNAGTLTATATIGLNMTANDTTTVVDNTIATIKWENLDTADVVFDDKENTHAATIRATRPTTNYKLRVWDGATTPKPVPNAWVWFTVNTYVTATQPQLADITVAPGTLTRTSANSAEVGVQTDAAGYANLAVNIAAAKAINGNGYGVSARSNLILAPGTGPNTQIVASYANAAPTTLQGVGNTAGEVGTSVTLTGKVMDQWKQLFTPTGPGVQATLTVTRNNVGTRSPGVTSPAPYAETVNIANGEFSATVRDATGNTNPVTDRYTWSLPGLPGSPVGPFDIRWLRSVVPTSVSGVSLNTVTSFPIPATSPLAVATGVGAGPGFALSATTNAVPLLGVVRDQGGDPLPFANFSVSGTDGVKFLDSAGNAQASLNVRTNAAGQLSANETANGIQVFFTKSGPATITIKSGSAPDTVVGFTVGAPGAGQAWRVDLFDAAGEPGENITIAAGVYDVFGNAVPGATVNLSLPNAEFGQLAPGPVAPATTSAVTSNNSGRATAIFTSGGQDAGNAPIRAEIAGGLPNRTGGNFGATGLSVLDSVDRDDNNVVVGPITVTLSAEPSRVGPGSVDLSGKANANAEVEIWAKRTGTSDEFRVVKTVTADAQGDFGTSLNVVRSNTLYAKMGNVNSAQVTTTVFSSVNFSARALGDHKVELRADGNPNQATRMSFYTVDSDGKLKKIQTVTTNSRGFGSYVWDAPAGEHTVRAYYVATGTRSAYGQAQIVNTP